MALHDGKRVLKDASGKLYKVAPQEAEQTMRANNWTDATDDDVQRRVQEKRESERFGGAGQTAMAVADKVVRTASFGALDDGGDATVRARVFDRQHPILSFVAQTAGAAAPGLLTGGAASALGAGRIGAGAAEGLAAAAADETEMARADERPISAGNIVMFGLGGELVGRGLPAMLRRAVKGRAPVTDATSAVAGEALEDLTSSTQARASSRAARAALGAADDATRAKALQAAPTEAIELASKEVSAALESARSIADEASGAADSIIDDIIAKDAPAQTNWATDTARTLRQQADELEAQSGIRWEQTAPGESVDDYLRRQRGEGPKDGPQYSKEELLKRSRQRQREAGYSVLGPNSQLPKSGVERETSVEMMRSRIKRLPEVPVDSLPQSPEYPRRKLEELRARLTPEERKAVFVDYVGSDYKEIRAALRGDPGATHPSANIIEGALEKLSVESPTDLGPLYRGMNVDDDALNEALLRGEFNTNSITSTSYSPREAVMFAQSAGDKNPVLIRFSKADRGALVNQFEQEVLLPRRGHFRIKERHRLDDGTLMITVEQTGKASDAQMRDLGALGSVDIGPKVSGKGPNFTPGGVLGGPMGNVALTGTGAVIGGQVDGKEGMAAGAGAGLLTSFLAGGKGGALLRRVADSLLDTQGAAKTFKAARAAASELKSAGAPPEIVEQLEKGLKDRSLWGRAAELQDDLSRAGSKLAAQDAVKAQASGLNWKTLADALKKPPGERGGIGRGLQESLEGVEDILSTASKWGLLGKGKLGKLGKLVASGRRAVGVADSASGSIASEAVETAVDMGLGAMGAPPVAGLAIKVASKVWRNIDDSAKLAVKDAARRFVRPVYDEAFDSPKALMATSALARFKGEYPDAQSSFEAKRKLLHESTQDPLTLPLAISESLGKLAQEDPRLFSQVAARLQSQLAYVKANLPPAVAASLMYPTGVPLSQQALRDYAVVWNSTFEPETVLDDLARGMASPEQMRVLSDVHQDLYADIQNELFFEVSTRFQDIPSQRKKQLDILFGTDGLAGPAFSSQAASYIGQATEMYAARGPGNATPMPAAEDMAPPAGSLNAIANGVTNRGA